MQDVLQSRHRCTSDGNKGTEWSIIYGVFIADVYLER